MNALDILTDADGNLVIRGDDLMLGDATPQLVRDLMLTRKGDMKWDPTVGVGIEDFLLTDSPDVARRVARTELDRDGFKIKTLVIDGETVLVDGSY